MSYDNHDLPPHATGMVISYDDFTIHQCALCGRTLGMGRGGTLIPLLPSLDLRGGPVIYTSLHPLFESDTPFCFTPLHCPSCGYVSDGRNKIHGANKRVKEKNYRQIFTDHTVPYDAVLHQASSYLYEKAGQFAAAAMQTLCAAWVCDDQKGKKRHAVRFRKRALKLIEQMRKTGRFLRDQQDVTELITVDLLRRSHQFALALATAKQFLATADTHGLPLLKQLLHYEISLIKKRDTDEHRITDVIPNWSAVPFISFTVAGLQYGAAAQLVEQQSDMLINQPVALLPEPENSYDKQAIAVYWNDARIGYVPRRKNKELAALFSAGYGDILLAHISAPEPDEWYDEQVEVTVSLLNRKPRPRFDG